jgi:hypothetical protein
LNPNQKPLTPGSATSRRLRPAPHRFLVQIPL